MATGKKTANGFWNYGEDDAAENASQLLNVGFTAAEQATLDLISDLGATNPENGLSSDPAMIGGAFRRETAQSIPNGLAALTPLLVPTEDLDRTPNNFEFHQDASPSKFTTTTSMAGKWGLVIAKAQFAFNATGMREVAVTRDGDTFDSSCVPAHPNRPTTVSTIRLVRFKNGQVFEGFVGQSSGGALDVLAAVTSLTVVLLGSSPDVGEPTPPISAPTGEVIKNWAYNASALGPSAFIADPGAGNAPTISISSTNGTSGPEAHKMVATASSNSGVVTPVAERVPVVAGDTFTFFTDVRNAAAAARLFCPLIRWYAADRITAVGAAVIGADVAIAAAAVGQLLLSAVAPAGAFYAAADMRRQGASGSTTGDTWYLDRLLYGVNLPVTFVPNTGWFFGGLASTADFKYEFTGVANASPSLRTAYVKSGEPTTPTPTPPPTGPDLLFDAQWADKGIANFVKTTDMGESLYEMVVDPSGQIPGRVARIVLTDKDIHPKTGSSAYPRAQVKTTTFFKEGSTYYVGLSIMAPAATLNIDPDPYDDENDQLDYGANRLMLHEIFGEPHTKGPNRLYLRGNRIVLIAGNATGGNPDLGSTHANAPFGSWNSGALAPLTWWHGILRYVMGKTAAAGSVTLWDKTGGSPFGGGYTNRPLYEGVMEGGLSVRHYKTMGPGNDDDNNYGTPKLSAADSTKDPNGGRMFKTATVYHGRYVIGKTFASVGG